MALPSSFRIVPIRLLSAALLIAWSPDAHTAFSLSKNQYQQGEAITATFTESPGNPLDWIGIYSNPGNGPVDGAFVGASTIWLYTSGSQTAGAGSVEGAVTFANPGLPPGNYIAFFLENDGYASIEDPVPFVITEADAGAPEFLVDPAVLVRAEQNEIYAGKLQPYVTDPETQDTLVFAKISGPDWLEVSENGDLGGTPGENDIGVNSFEISVTDSHDLSDSATVNIEVTPAGGAPVDKINLMTYNLWVGGTPSKNLTALVKSGVDVIGLQETNGQRATEHAADFGWHAVQSGGSVAVLSKYPIVEQYDSGAGIGARIRISVSPPQEIVVWSCHLTAFPYGPYDGCFDGASEAAILANETASGRLPQVRSILQAMTDQIGNADRVPVFLVGDFNTPSHLDWTVATSDTHCGYEIEWPVTKAVEAAGLTDAYREAYPDPLAMPGTTWSPIYALRDNVGPDPEPQDRIDMIHYKGAGVSVESAEVYVLPGPLENIPNHGGNAWGSDHASVVSTISLPIPDPNAIPSVFAPQPADLSNEIDAADLTLTWAGGDGADSYRVLLGTNQSLTGEDLLGEPTETSIPAGELSPGTTYFWQVIAVKGANTLSGPVWRFATDTGIIEVAKWDFDEGEGTETSEALGTGITGQFVDLDTSAWTDTEILGKGVRLSADDGWVAFGNDPRLRPANTLTVSAWVNPASFAEWGGIAGFVHDTGATESGFSLHTRSGNQFGWGVGIADSGVITYLSGGANLVENNWYHVVGTYDGVESALYVNGSKVGSTTQSGPIDWDPLPEKGLVVGSYLDDNDDLRFDGTVTQVRLWRKALSPQEIAGLFVEQEFAICPSGLNCQTDDEAGTVLLTWVPGTNLSGEGVEILRDGTVLAELGLDDEQYLDSPPNAGDPGKIEIEYTLRVKGGDPDECPPLTCTASFFNGGITDDLVLYLRMDGDFVDSSPDPLDSIQVFGSPLNIEGQVGPAYRFEDTAQPRQYALLGDPAALQFGETTDFTVAFWVRSTSDFTDNRDNGGTNYDPAILSNKDWNSGANVGWVIAGNSSNQGGGIGNLEWNIGDGSNRADFDPVNLQINDGAWHHVAVSHNRDGDARFYLDGINVGAVDISPIGDINSGLPTAVGTDGAEGGTWENWFPGDIDDVAIWRRVVTPSEIATIHADGLLGDGLPSEGDLDGDGLPDAWETQHFGDTTSHRGGGDSDGDGLNQIGEWRAATDPNNADSDNDGATDGREVVFGTDPLDNASLPPANGVVLAVSNSAAQNWDTAAVWFDKQTPSGQNAYFVNGSAPVLRSPLLPGPEFGGASLTMLEGSRLWLQHSGTAGVATLDLSGGEVVFNGIPGGNTGLGRGSDLLSVESDSVIRFAVTGTLTLEAKITGSAQVTVAGTNEGSTLRLGNAANTFSGVWRVEGGTLTATASEALASTDIVMAGGILDAGGPLNSPASSLTLTSSESRIVFRYPMAFKTVSVVPQDGGDLITVPDGEYDSGDLSDFGLGEVFGEGNGLLIVGGEIELPETSDFHIVSVRRTGEGKFAVTWTSEPNKSYGVQFSSDLNAPWTELAETNEGDGGTTSREVTTNGNAGFLRVVEK